LVMLPRPFKGLSVFANYTRLLTSSSPDAPPAPGTVPNTALVDFTPNTYNIGLSIDQSRFAVRAEYHFKSRLKSANNPNPIFVQYFSPDATVDVNFTFKLNRSTALFLDVVNLLNESPYVYIGNTSRRQINEVYGTRVNAGVSSRF
jgi:outer membrane receptor protein involved in Fe transport